MTAPLTPEDLDAIRARWETATPGPWEAYIDLRGPCGQLMMILSRGRGSVADRVTRDDDAEAIAHAPEDVARLLAEIDRLRALLTPVQDAAVAWREARRDRRQQGDAETHHADVLGELEQAALATLNEVPR